jgi:predicted transglutaminase-like cysteine proteinase
MRGRDVIFGSMLLTMWVTCGTTATPRLISDEPTLAPMAFTKFCFRYPTECETTAGSFAIFSATPIVLTQERHAQLAAVNSAVNRDIAPRAASTSPAHENWLIKPNAGDCNDYAVTKRHELLAKGWPSRALLLTEVALPTGEHHLVLVVRTNEGDLVLDNLKPDLRSVAKDGRKYKWMRMETALNPNNWAIVHLVT